MFRRLESSIERTCERLAADRGWRLLKFSRRIGDPDRILLIPGGRVAFMEFKQEGVELRRVQAYRAKELREMGFDVFRVDSTSAFNLLCDQLQPRNKPRASVMDIPPRRTPIGDDHA